MWQVNPRAAVFRLFQKMVAAVLAILDEHVVRLLRIGPTRCTSLHLHVHALELNGARRRATICRRTGINRRQP